MSLNLQAPVEHRNGTAALDTLVRVVAVANMQVMGVEALPWFGGTATEVGVVDRLLGVFRIGGLRIDLLWLGCCNLLFFCVLIASLVHLRRPYARVNAFFALAALASFYYFVQHSLRAGVLDMG